MKESGRLFLIDGSSFFYRAFYAIRSLNTSKGQPTNAIYGVIMMLKKLIEEEKPEYLAVAFDTQKPTFRHQRYEAYKEHRRPMPEALVSQLPWIRQVLEGFRIPIFEREGYEADDILGTLALRAAKEGLTVYLVTGDKDALQLVGPRVKVYRPTREGHEIIDDETLVQRWHIRPSQVVEVMALMGDDVDEIPGVPGIGEKTALALIQQFGSVEKLMKSLEEVPQAARRLALQEHAQQLRLSRELVLLDTQVPVEFDLKNLERAKPDREALRQLFQTLEFRTLLKDLAPENPRQGRGLKSIESEAQWIQLLPKIRQADCVSIVLATDNPRLMEAHLLGVGLAWASPGTKEPVNALVSDPALLESLRPVLEDPNLVKVCPGLKETFLLLKERNLTLHGPWTDPCLASYLLDPSRPSHQMEALAQEFLGESIEHPDPVQAAGFKAEAALRLMPRLEREIEEKQLSILLNEVEIPLASVLSKMEAAGIAVDLDELGSLAKQMAQTLEGLTQQIYSLAGEPFNINSPKQLALVLFERLKLPILKRTKTGASTDEEVLRRLSTGHELPAKILEYREMYKLSSTYVGALPKLISPKTGRIHTSFNQTVTATGRLSSSDPNLQNIPIRTELGRQIRRAFVPSDPGSRFLAADYSQIELRILAHLSQDEAFLQAFRQGQDVHRMTAAQVFHVEPEKATDAQRSAAKTINFGILYGMSSFGLSKELGISPAEAQDFIERYFARYPGVRSYLMRSMEEARGKGYCTTLFHRRRYIPELTAKDVVVRQFAQRTAINAPIQGSAADLIKVAMVAVDRAIEEHRLNSRMLLTVHDELIFEVPVPELDEMQVLVKETMERPTLSGSPIELSVPIEVNLKVGRNWLEASHG